MIDNFTNHDLTAAGALTCSIWGQELEGESTAFKRFVYEAMTRYYCRNNSFSFKLQEGSTLKGFLLAALPEDSNSSKLWFAENLHRFSAREQQIAAAYLEYLAFNGQRISRCTAVGDLQLLLFLSTAAGGGSRLLQHTEQAAMQAGIKNLLLWADETCDTEYYLKKGFCIADIFTNNKMPQLGAQKTFVFRKSLSLKKERKAEQFQEKY